MSTVYECQNCDWEGENPPEAKRLSMRLAPGDKYTDVECPECGALVHEAEPDLDTEERIAEMARAMVTVAKDGGLTAYDLLAIVSGQMKKQGMDDL